MNHLRFVLFILCLLFAGSHTSGQQPDRDQGKFVEYENAFYQQIKASLDSTGEEQPDTVFKMDVSGYDLPGSPEEFKQAWYNPPLSQGRTGTCWCFCTTSFFESEIYRLTGKQVKLSEMYTVYWEYVEKARRFMRTRGDSYFAQGSEANAVPRIWEKYGIVPADAYTGKPPEQKFHDHREMFTEMKDFLNSVKETNNWNESAALSTIRSILDHYMGPPPETVTAGNTTYSPREYLQKVLEINLDEYVDILSLKEKPYYRQVEYPVPDNWWHSDIYYNVPLDVFMSAIKQAVREGYTLSIGGDVSEAGYLADQDVAMVPSFDIPSEYITEDARQFRFSNETTTDDHGIHLVGYQETDSADWYLIKDSGSSARNGEDKGFFFFHEDYVKLKMMDFMIHKDAVEEVLKEFSSQ